MRDAFTRALQRLAAEDKNLLLVTGDLGFGVLKPFWETYPDQFINAGIAEQAMTSLAAGLAREGKTVLTYSIANFPTLRCLEQIRNDVCYHNANVKIVNIGGGVSYGALGVSHHSTEDIAILRALPNMVVVVPCDNIEAEAATRAVFEYEGPVFYRCGYKNEKDIHHTDAKGLNFQLGKAITVEEGSDCTVIFCGPIGFEAQKAVIAAREKGINCRLLSMHTIKPIDKEAIVKAAQETGRIITVEEHNLSGGLGSAVAEVLMDEGCGGVKMKRIALPDINVHQVGSQQWLREYYHLTAPYIEEAIVNICK